MLSLQTLTAAAIALMQTFSPVWYPTTGEFTNPETDEQRDDRWEMIAEVNAEVAYGDKGKNITPWSPQDDLALIKAVQRGESAFEYRVHAGVPSHIGTADAGKAKCLGQIHYVKAWWTEAEWEALAGTDRAATKRCAEAILRVFAYHAKRCKFRHEIDKKKRWATRIQYREARRLIRWYGNGNCGYRMTKTMSQKALNFLRFQRKIDVVLATPMLAPDKERLASQP